MGGKGSGGRRQNSGRPKKTAPLAFVHGHRGSARVESAPMVFAPVVPVEMPELPDDVAVIWAELAPHALQNRTLTNETVRAFQDLCEAVVHKRAMFATIQRDGLTFLKVCVDGSGQEHQEIKAHPLLSRHTALMVRVESGLQRFRLAPDGKDRTTGGSERPKSALEQLQAQVVGLRRPVRV